MHGKLQKMREKTCRKRNNHSRRQHHKGNVAINRYCKTERELNVNNNNLKE